MIATHVESRTTEQTVVDDYVCNRCAGSCVENGEPCGLIEVSVSGGYNSPRLPDGSDFSFSLCEKCLGEMFSSFKIQPEYHDVAGMYLGNGMWIDGAYVYQDEPDKLHTALLGLSRARAVETAQKLGWTNIQIRERCVAYTCEYIADRLQLHVINDKVIHVAVG